MDQPTRTMTPEQVHKMLVYMNQADPRIEPNSVNVRIYGNAVGRFEPGLITDVFDRYMENNVEDRKLAVGMLKRLCQSEYEARQREAQRNAPKSIDPGKKSMSQWKEKFPGRALEEYEKGRYLQNPAGYQPLPAHKVPAWTHTNESVFNGLTKTP